MKIRFWGNDYELKFGRPRYEPNRETVVIYENAGFSIAKVNKLIKKRVTPSCLRRFAKMPVVKRAIDIKKNGLLNLPWVIDKVNPTDKHDYTKDINVITSCLEYPNNGDTFINLFGAVIEDIESGDCGAIEVVKCGNPDRPIKLYGVDGFTIEYNSEWNDSPNNVRYLQKDPNTGKYINLLDQDLMYMKCTDYTFSPFGNSPLESSFNLINYLLNTQEYAATVTSKAIPKFLINLGKNADEQTIAKFRKYFDEEIYGTGNMPIVGGSDGIQTSQLAAINDEGLYLTWQHFLITIVAYTFGIDPKRFNEGSQTDRSTVDEQKENINVEAIKPLARVIASEINKKVIARLGFGGKLQFHFIFEDTESRKKAKTDRVLTLFNSDLFTQNEARQELGYNVATGKYGDMYKSQMKADINAEYQVQGGYNGVGNNPYENKDTSDTGGDNNNVNSK
jgi:hypothetical protein